MLYLSQSNKNPRKDGKHAYNISYDVIYIGSLTCKEMLLDDGQYSRIICF